MQSSVVPQIIVKSVSKKQVEKENKKKIPSTKFQSPILKVFGDSSNKQSMKKETVKSEEIELRKKTTKEVKKTLEEAELICPLKDHF